MAKLDSTQRAEICRRYLAGENLARLGKAFEVGKSTVHRVLRAEGVQARNPSEAKGGLSAEAKAETCARYKAGENSHQLGAAFGVTHFTIIKILKRNGITPRTNSESKGGLSAEAQVEVRRRYQAGENTIQLGDAYGVTDSTIGKILKAEGVQCRSRSFPKTQHPEICRRYLAGESTYQIGAAFGVTAPCVSQVLKRNGIAPRTSGEAQRSLPAEAEAEVCSRYLARKNLTHLGAAFGVSDTTILNILRRNGIERRASNGFGDSVQHVLDCTGHHAMPRECELYLFELAHYSDTHCKPGIAFDADARARLGNGEYGAEVLRLVFATRAEAYFLEQALLDATRGCADCPSDLCEWAGASEVRAMPASDLVPVVLRLAEELDELSMWEFAARYVPMTAAQRAICQQRAVGQQEEGQLDLAQSNTTPA